ncbi:MAG: biopolymer transporter ExbD [Deltaproteobacteria bacterium]|nr:biopolymer transporter ExbD [Deltaproteobacteria bacterium]
MVKVKTFERRGARLEMTPLMDLMFTLLVFFIYSMLSMTIHHGIPLTLPEAKSSSLERHQNIQISVTKTGHIFVNKREVELRDLANEILMARKGNKKITVLISGDGAVSYKRIMEVLDTLRTHGISDVVLETRHE